MKKSHLLGVVCACLLSPVVANASTLISNNFQRTGASEQIIAPFIDDNGVQTVNTYSGFLEVMVSGIGSSLKPATNDAFYAVYKHNYGCVTEGVQIKSSCNYAPTV